MTSLRNSLINLSLSGPDWWRAQAGPAAATCRVSVLITIKTFWILIQTTILTRAGLFLISWLPWPRCEAPLSRVIGKWRKTWPRSRGFMFNFHYWHRVSCEDNFHNQSPELRRSRRERPIMTIHTKTSWWTKIPPQEIKISLNIWSSEMYKGLAIYIGARWAGQGRGRGEQGLGRGAGSKHDLGLARAHPSSRGGGGRGSQGPGLHPQRSPCTQHYQNIDQRNIKTRGCECVSLLCSPCLPHETCRDLLMSPHHLARGPPPDPVPAHIAWQGRDQGLGQQGNWEIGNPCDLGPGAACPESDLMPSEPPPSSHI